jgi:NAD(P)-dependent dehydrogenase (short-subunit alcohol dehydrogenase family)
MVKLRPLLKASKCGRIVNVASNYAGNVDLDDLFFEKRKYTSNDAYMQSKACDRMLTKAAANAFQEDDIIVTACHPGVVTSALLQGNINFFV